MNTPSRSRQVLSQSDDLPLTSAVKTNLLGNKVLAS